MRERVRVRGKFWIYWHRCPLIRPSATFSHREKELFANKSESGIQMIFQYKE
jgi:hypothetical protein